MSEIILGKTEKLRQSVIAESPAANRKTICKDKLSTCKAGSRKRKSSKTSEAESILSEKVYEPFWNEQLTEISSGLYLPTKTDYQDLDLSLSNGLLRNPMVNSWFSTNLIYHLNKSLHRIYSPSCTSFLAECTDLEVTKTKLIRLSPASQQKVTFKHRTDISRYVFNQTIDYILSCVGFTPSWMDIKKDLLKILPEWCRDVPFQIKGIAVKEAHQAFFKANGKPEFRAKKTS
jgi:putative transposase